MSFDRLLREVGDRGSFQIYCMIMMAFAKMFLGIQTMIPVFISAKQDYKCKLPFNWTDGPNGTTDNSTFFLYPEKCSILNVSDEGNYSVPCDDWDFDETVFSLTIRSSFKLTCEREWLVSIPSTLFMAGLLVGSLLYGVMSDKCGRISTLFFCTVQTVIVAVCAAFSTNFWLYSVMRLLTGFGVAGMLTTINTYAVEVLTMYKRIFYIMVNMNGWAVGTVLLVLLAYYVRNSVHLQLITALSTAVVCLYIILFPESPRWLLLRGKQHRAYHASHRIAWINGKNIPAYKFNQLCAAITPGSEQKNQTLKELFTYPRLRSVTLVVWLAYAVASYVYYVLSLGSGYLGTNVFVSLLIMASLEIPSRLVTTFVGNYFGRIPLLGTTYIAAGVFILACAPIYERKGLETVLLVFCILGRMLAGMSFDLIWLYALEIFPTTVRNTGVGSASMWARVGGLLSPQMGILIKIWPPLPFIISGVLPIVTGLACIFVLPETVGMKTSEHLKEGEEFLSRSHRRSSVISRISSFNNSFMSSTRKGSNAPAHLSLEAADLMENGDGGDGGDGDGGVVTFSVPD